MPSGSLDTNTSTNYEEGIYRKCLQRLPLSRYWNSSKLTATYKYEPLDEDKEEIRLLTLCPAQDSRSKIKISIHHTPFTASNTPVYEALSYTWGSTDNPIIIRVGLDGTNTLSVTRNLGIALSHLQYQDKPRILWIDAICINQNDVKERNEQVKRMRDIYKRADRVVVWLGPEAGASARAMRLLSSLSSKVHLNETESGYGELEMRSTELSADEPHWADRYVPLPYTPSDFRALDRLLHRPWFDRLWIRQEIVLAKSNATVVCGKATISWQDFRTSSYMLRYKCFVSDTLPSADMIKFTNRTNFLLELINHNSHDPAWIKLRKAGPAQCTDARDRIYGMLGLIQDGEGDMGIEPDYALSISEVHIRFVLSLLNFQGRIDALRCCDISDNSAQMPSWVPSWSIKTSIYPGNSDAHAPANAQYLGNGVLKADGIFLATLKTTDEYRHTIFSDPFFSEICRLAPKDVLTASYIRGGSLLDAFCRTMCMDGFARLRLDNKPSSAGLPYFQPSKELLHKVLSSKEEEWPKKFENGGSGTFFLDRSMISMPGRCFFTTEEGFIGLAPKAAKPGDVVCILLGCDVPLVLRPFGQNQYQVVGESYVDRVMDGELLYGNLPEKYWQAEWTSTEEGSRESYLMVVNNETWETCPTDPRLSQFLKGDEKVTWKTAGTSSVLPILTPERLKETGVDITSFELV